jgi:3-phosphoshikimate 1-carboxyvinyltransferase
MACALMGMVASGTTVVHNAECIDISFPGFQKVLESLYAYDVN